MRFVTPERLRAAGILLLEAVSLGLLLARRYSKDDELRNAVRAFAQKARSL